MTDIVEQAARVLDKAMAANIYKRFDPATGPTFGESIAQALTDAGLLREARTVPSREEIGEVVCAKSHYDGNCGCGRDDRAADAILALLADQPTVAEAKAQALEEFAEVWATGEWSDWFLAENVTCDVSAVQATDKALRERAQEIREYQ